MRANPRKQTHTSSTMRTSKEYVLRVSTKGFVSQFSFVNPPNLVSTPEHIRSYSECRHRTNWDTALSPTVSAPWSFPASPALYRILALSLALPLLPPVSSASRYGLSLGPPSLSSDPPSAVILFLGPSLAFPLLFTGSDLIRLVSSLSLLGLGARSRRRERLGSKATRREKTGILALFQAQALPLLLDPPP